MALPALAEAGSLEPTQGQLMARTDRGPVPLPLLKTQVLGHISGALAHVTVRQTFHNPHIKPLEAIYVFPLPDGASVHGVVVTNGKRVVKGVIKPRADAVEVYRKARDDGDLVALLEQERPNIFTQSVANILPKTKLVVDIEYDVHLSYRDGYYTFAYPMVVGARYIPGQLDGKVPVGHGTHPDTDRVPDASRITPPVKRSGRTIDLAITVDPGAPAREILSPTHAITTAAAPDRGAHAIRVALAAGAEIPNKDFVIRYRLADDKPAMSVLSHGDRRGGFFTMRVEPPHQPVAGDVSPRALTLLLDTSGSLAGAPLAQMKSAARRLIDGLGGSDTVQILTVDRRRLASRPLHATPDNLARARRFVDELAPSGRTDLLAALRAAVAIAATDVARLSIVCVITDGYVGDDQRVVADIGARLGPRTRLFALGVGSAPNRYLLERLAEVGRGAVDYVIPGDEPEVIAAFARRLRAPLLTDVSIDWKGLAVSQILPAALPDLFVGQPLSVVGRFGQSGAATIDVRGRIGGRPVVFKVPVKLERSERNEAIAREWARARVRALALEEAGGADRSAAITRLGLDFSLMTAHTALVAVVGDVAVAPGDLRTRMLPVERPSGMSRDGDGDDGMTDDSPEPDAGATDEGYDDDEDEDKPDERRTRVSKGEATAGSAAPAPVLREESLTISGDASILARRWRLTLGGGLGASTIGDNVVAGTITLGFDRFVGRFIGDRFAIGAGATLQLRGGDTEEVAGSVLLQLSHLNLFGRLLGPLRLELTGGLGLSITGDNAGLGVSGALKLVPRLLPVGLQLRYDGAIRAGDPDLAIITGGIEVAF